MTAEPDAFERLARALADHPEPAARLIAASVRTLAARVFTHLDEAPRDEAETNLPDTIRALDLQIEIAAPDLRDDFNRACEEIGW